MDRDLSLRERCSLRFHLMICGMCRTYRRQLRLIRRLLRVEAGAGEAGDAGGLSAELLLSAAARERIARALGNQT